MDDIFYILSIIGVAVMRPLGAVIFLPVFSTSMLGGTLIRNALVLMSIFPVLPVLVTLTLPSPIHDPADYALLLMKELTVGLLLGFSATLVFWALDMMGFIIDTMRGSSISSVFNPLLTGQSSLIGMLFAQFAAVLYLVAGGFHALLTTLYDSYSYLPPGQNWQWKAGFITLLKQEWGLLNYLALSFGMPAIVIMVLIDMGLGLVNRSVQQLNVFSLSMPIKSVVVLLMLLIGLPFGMSSVLDTFSHFDGGLITQLEPVK